MTLAYVAHAFSLAVLELSRLHDKVLHRGLQNSDFTLENLSARLLLY